VALIDAVVLLYGDRGDLDRCVDSLKTHCPQVNIIVIDNNQVNRGFTKGTNDGIKMGSAPYIWLINQDAVALPGADTALVKRLESGPRVGIAGSMQLDPDDHDIIRHGGTTVFFPAGVHKGGRVSMGHCRLPEKLTWVNFASVMLKREMVQEIGLLDEKMFLLFSDSDYCLWARYRGWEVWYEPESHVYHRLGKASKSVSEWQQKDMQAFMDKWGIIPLQNGFEAGRMFGKLNANP